MDRRTFLEERIPSAKAPGRKKLGKLGSREENSSVSGVGGNGIRGRNQTLWGLIGQVRVSGFYCYCNEEFKQGGGLS